MITLTCKSYRARVDGEKVVLEIDQAQPMNFVPQLMSKADVASRLQVSIRKVAEIAQSGRLPVVRVDGAVRFREEDVLRLLTENQGPKPRLLALPTRIRSEAQTRM
ncbi:MAG TPA: helix-turn-helix domain-containing protein [Verrucomicrobiae bacterium]|nr:helix-turn-helix domain-containing protein [Verrucomicrobiae bacterium]